MNLITQLARRSNFLNETPLSGIFTDEFAEVLNSFGLTPLNEAVTSMVKDMQRMTELTNDIDGLREVLPEFSSLSEDYYVNCAEGIANLTDTLSTPDVKLYYPEPFIASPSFVHEDLWFIHILHYQH